MSAPMDKAVAAARATREFQAGSAFGVPDEAKDQYLRALIEAAAPAIRAQAWDEGYAAAEYMAKCWGHVDHWGNEPANPYRASGEGAQG